MAGESNKPDYWFPARKYGWGWGPPVTWQGWIALGVAVVLLLADGLFYLPSAQPYPFAALAVVIAIALTAVCWIKGEPPRWRWGERE